MQIKFEYLLIAIIILIGLHLLISRCNCERFSVGIVFEDRNNTLGDLGKDEHQNRNIFLHMGLFL